MKILVTVLCLCFSGATSAEIILIPQCLGSKHVFQEEPYLLTLNNVNPANLNIMVSDLTNSGLIVVTDLLYHESSQLLVLAVDANKASIQPSSRTSSARYINKAVAQKVRATFRKYKTTYYLECNGNIAS